ncbi:MAG: chemotaxis protein CheB [Ferruginibacter sp.]
MKIVVIGGSAGSLRSLKKITSGISKNIDAAVFVVIHFPPDKTSNLPAILNRENEVPAVFATHHSTIETGKIYVATSDHHLIIEKGKMLLVHGPKENRFRPSIDVLFRSAAVAYDAKVIGIILSGLLDDGTSGLSTIKENNGVAIVQDPEDAEFKNMPLSALRNVAVDHCVPAKEIAALINNPANKQPKEIGMKNGERLQWENKIARGMNTSFDDIKKYATSTRYICPQCEGPLFHINDDKVTRYRCFTGHAFTSATLLQDISEKVEHLLWTTFRTMDEKREMIQNFTEQNDELVKEKEKLEIQLEVIKKLLEQ